MQKESTTLKPYERRLIVALLELASDSFANHGCNDFDLTKYLTLPQRYELAQAMAISNGAPDEYDPERVDIANDGVLMSYFADRLRDEKEN